MSLLSRRKLLYGGLSAAAGATGLVAAGRLARQYGLVPPDHGGLYGPGETLTYAAQHLLGSHSMAREFSRSQISSAPFANGKPLKDEAYQRLEAGAFAGWQLAVDGMVTRPTIFSIADLKTLTAHTQITHLACEEGWSYIAEWSGAPVSAVLKACGALPQARFVMYSSLEADSWDSMDMSDALHPQTLVAYGMNGADVPARFGGPLRMRLPRQLGYKSLKYLNRMTVTDDMKKFGKGLGAVAPEYGYAWYAGI